MAIHEIIAPIHAAALHEVMTVKSKKLRFAISEDIPTPQRCSYEHKVMYLPTENRSTKYPKKSIGNKWVF